MNLKSGGSAFDMDFDNQDNLYVIRYNSSTNTSTLCQISTSNGSVFVASNPVFWPSTTYTYVSLAIDGSLTNAYSWSPSVGLDDSLAANPKLTATTNMQYVLSVKDGCGTIAKDTVQVSLGSKSNAEQKTHVGSSYTFNGQTYTQSGIYNDTLPSAAGCDSIITLNLTINANPSPTVTTRAMI